MKTNENRNIQFTILQAIAITTVVVGHKGSISILKDWFPIYSYHMPLFIFISGYFYKSINESNPVKYIVNKIKKLLLPYFIWNLIYGVLITILRNNFHVTYGSKFTLYNLFVQPWITGHQFGLNVASWFVLALFLIQTCYLFMRCILKLVKLDNELLMTIICLLAGIFAMKQGNLGLTKGFNLTLIHIAFGLPFYQLGYLYKTKLEKLDKLNNWIYFLVLFIIQITIFTTQRYIPATSMVFGIFDKQYLLKPLLAAITGIALWLRISKIFIPICKDSKIINYIGNNTWSIMMHHQLVFFVTNVVLLKLSRMLNWKAFDVKAFKTNIWYTYSPSSNHFVLLYVILGIGVPLLVKYYGENLVIKIKGKFNISYKTLLYKNPNNPPAA